MWLQSMNLMNELSEAPIFSSLRQVTFGRLAKFSVRSFKHLSLKNLLWEKLTPLMKLYSCLIVSKTGQKVLSQILHY